jgi:hypothetical protein
LALSKSGKVGVFNSLSACPQAPFFNIIPLLSELSRGQHDTVKAEPVQTKESVTGILLYLGYYAIMIPYSDNKFSEESALCRIL